MYEPSAAECPVLAAYGGQNKCGVKVEYDDWNKIQEMEVTVKKDATYNMNNRIIVLQLEVANDLDLNTFWQGYQIPDITVSTVFLCLMRL